MSRGPFSVKHSCHPSAVGFDRSLSISRKSGVLWCSCRWSHAVSLFESKLLFTTAIPVETRLRVSVRPSADDERRGPWSGQVECRAPGICQGSSYRNLSTLLMMIPPYDFSSLAYCPVSIPEYCSRVLDFATIV